MVHNRLLLSLLGSCCFIQCSLVPSMAGAETLSEAIISALNQNPTVEQAIAVQEMARKDKSIESSNYFPTVSLSTAAGRVYGDNATSRGLSVTRGSGYSNTWEGSLSINQMIFDSLKTPRLVGAAEERVAASEQALKDTRESLALQTALAYMNVMRTRESVNILRSYSGTLSDYQSKIEKMVKAGAADEAELQQASSLEIELRGLLAGFEGQSRAADAEFARLTGHIPETSMSKPDPVLTLLPVSLDEAISYASKNHPQVKMADREIQSAVLTQKAQSSSLYPTVSGELSTFNKDVADVIGGEVEDNRALVRLNWSMSAGGAELSRVDKAREETAKAKSHKEELLRDLVASIRTAYSDKDASALQYEVASERLSTTQNLLNAYQAQFEGGKVRILQLLQAENQVLNARLDEVNAGYRALAAQYSVLGSVAQIQERLVPTAQTQHVQ